MFMKKKNCSWDEDNTIYKDKSIYDMKRKSQDNILNNTNSTVEKQEENKKPKSKRKGNILSHIFDIIEFIVDIIVEIFD